MEDISCPGFYNLRVYLLYDKVSASFVRSFIYQTNDMARRGVSNFLKSNFDFKFSALDYDLYLVGVCNGKTGYIQSCDREFICSFDKECDFNEKND